MNAKKALKRRRGNGTKTTFGTWFRAYRGTLVLAAGVFALSAWTTVTTVSYVNTYRLWYDTAEDLRDLERSYANLLSDTQLSKAAFLQEIDNFENASDQQVTTLHAIRDLRRNLLAQLEQRDRQLEQITQQQERANALIAEFERSIAGSEGLLQSVVEEKTFLRERLEATKGQLAEISQQRDAGERVEMGLRWRLAKLETELQQQRSDSGRIAHVWLKDWIMGSADALEGLFAETGIDVTMLIDRARDNTQGQGGPFQLASTESSQPRAPGDPVAEDIQRLAALQQVATVLPLSAPMDHYNLTSSFGLRSDPITGELAFHGGLDFGAAPNTRIRATAPGRVVHAGPLGPYGNTVEIDHGMGVTTRFGHMKSVTVEVGQPVGYRDVIGVIGSTGRSTGRHLHYEVRIDGDPYDPAKFLNAGRYLVWAFAANQS
jgi:murein DD-endopeptidase MepM/ murein hydrolase activator NlpD